MESAPKDNCLSGSEYSHLIQKTPSLYRDNATEMLDVVGIL